MNPREWQERLNEPPRYVCLSIKDTEHPEQTSPPPPRLHHITLLNACGLAFQGYCLMMTFITKAKKIVNDVVATWKRVLVMRSAGRGSGHTLQ